MNSKNVLCHYDSVTSKLRRATFTSVSKYCKCIHIDIPYIVISITLHQIEPQQKLQSRVSKEEKLCLRWSL